MRTSSAELLGKSSEIAVTASFSRWQDGEVAPL
jgi:hypothetical protein